MFNLHGGTTIGLATSATLNVGGAVLAHNAGLVFLTIALVCLTTLSTVIAVAMLVRFGRNHARHQTQDAVFAARRAWRAALLREGQITNGNHNPHL